MCNKSKLLHGLIFLTVVFSLSSCGPKETEPVLIEEITVEEKNISLSQKGNSWQSVKNNLSDAFTSKGYIFKDTYTGLTNIQKQNTFTLSINKDINIFTYKTYLSVRSNIPQEGIDVSAVTKVTYFDKANKLHTLTDLSSNIDGIDLGNFVEEKNINDYVKTIMIDISCSVNRKQNLQGYTDCTFTLSNISSK